MCIRDSPYGVRSFDKEAGVVGKCTLCSQLTADGYSKDVYKRQEKKRPRMVG